MVFCVVKLSPNACIYNILFVYIGGDILKINRAYVFRLYPNNQQKELIEKNFGISRFIYNYFLGLNNNYMNKYDYIKQLPKLKEIPIRGYRNLKEFKGRIINATIYKEASKYYVSLCVEEDIIIQNVRPSSIMGIDLGIKDNARKYLLHSISKKLTDENDIVVTEKLNI